MLQRSNWSGRDIPTTALANEGGYGAFFASVVGLTLLLLLVALGAVVAVDPYAEHGDEAGLYLAFNQNTIHRYQEYLSQAPYTLVFGTSRSHMFSDGVTGRKVLNLHAVYGWPDTVSRFLEDLDDTQRNNVQGIIYLIDLHTFRHGDTLDNHVAQGGVQRFLNRVINFRSYAKETAAKVWAWATGQHDYHIHARGFRVLDIPRHWDGVWREALEPNYQSFEADEVRKLARVKEFAARHHIPITFMTPTLPDKTVRELLDGPQLCRQKQAFFEAIGPFADLTHVSGISDSEEYFADATHLNTAGAKTLFAAFPWPDRTATENGLRHCLDDLGQGER